MLLPNTNGGFTYMPDPPATCPSCGKTEDIKEVCRHCNYEYPPEPNDPWYKIIYIIFIVLAIIALIIFIVALLFQWISDDDKLHTLVAYFIFDTKVIYKFLSGLLRRIY